jgi:hypothetical protein
MLNGQNDIKHDEIANLITHLNKIYTLYKIKP